MKTISLLTVTLLGTGLLFSGCSTLGLTSEKIPKGAVSFEAGEMIILDPLPLARVWRATESALGSLNDLQLIPLKKEQDGLGALVEALGAGGKQVRIKLRKADAKTTEIRIRIGLGGDEAYSQQLYESIRRNYSD